MQVRLRRVLNHPHLSNASFGSAPVKSILCAANRKIAARWADSRSCSSTVNPINQEPLDDDGMLTSTDSTLASNVSEENLENINEEVSSLELRKNPILVDPPKRNIPSVHDPPQIVRPGEHADIQTVIRNYWSTPGKFNIFILIEILKFIKMK